MNMLNFTYLKLIQLSISIHGSWQCYICCSCTVCRCKTTKKHTWLGGSFGLSTPGLGVGGCAGVGLGGRLLVLLREETCLAAPRNVPAPSIRSGLFRGLAVGARVLLVSSVLFLFRFASFPLPRDFTQEWWGHSALWRQVKDVFNICLIPWLSLNIIVYTHV